MTNTRTEFFPLKEIIDEFKEYLKKGISFDVVSIVGEGEPTLYLKLEELILSLKELTDKPVVVITNGSLLYLEEVRKALYNADIVLPSIDGYNEDSFKKINRPYGKIEYQKVTDGLKELSENFKGELWHEIMLMKGINDSKEQIMEYKKILDEIQYDRLYINTPVRPPAEENIEEIDKNTMEYAVNNLGGISIDLISSQGFSSDIDDHKTAVKSIIKRHPMNQMEIKSFLESRECDQEEIEKIITELKEDKKVAVKEYKGYNTFRSQ
jgi:wyosine [tRNA(Phe)-imidazoG37] synthetase (radical SAM superfamily)